MNLIFYLIIGWLFGELIHFSCWEGVKRKFNLDNKKVKTILIFVAIAIIIASVGSGFYRVESTENVVLTKISGNKEVIKNPGIKFSLLSSREDINMQKQIIRFPDNSDYDAITFDEKPLSVNSFLEYKIINANFWAIENKDSQEKLRIALASSTKNIIQTSTYSYIYSNIKQLEKSIEEDLSKLSQNYGIEVIKVTLIVTDTNLVKTAKTNAESQKITSESLKSSYLSESEALKTKYNSLEDKDFIKYMEFLKAIKEGKIQTIVIPEESITSINLEKQ